MPVLKLHQDRKESPTESPAGSSLSVKESLVEHAQDLWSMDWSWIAIARTGVYTVTVYLEVCSPACDFRPSLNCAVVDRDPF